jgi:hypothetical protein
LSVRLALSSFHVSSYLTVYQLEYFVVHALHPRSSNTDQDESNHRNLSSILNARTFPCRGALPCLLPLHSPAIEIGCSCRLILGRRVIWLIGSFENVPFPSRFLETRLSSSVQNKLPFSQSPGRQVRWFNDGTHRVIGMDRTGISRAILLLNDGP